MRVIENVKLSLWNEIAEKSPHATFFHTPYWSEIMVKTFSCKDITKAFVFDDGTTVIFPFIQTKGKITNLFLNDYRSGYPYTYGGPISDRILSFEKYNEIIDYFKTVLKKYYRILVRGNPYTDGFKTIDFQEAWDLSHVAELIKCKNEDDVFKTYGRRYRSYIRKAIRSNTLKVKEAKTIHEYENLYNIYKRSQRYWDVVLTHYPLRLFKNLYNMKCKHIKLWTVYCKDKMVGGDVTLYWKNRCFMWLSYHEREFSKLHSRRYMLHNVFLDCKERGVEYYDFLQSGGIESQEKFKRSMGGKEYQHCAWLKENYLVSLAKKKRF
ncbi:MAG: GNAT family N-acetyltransferase [Desulfosarcina sp.]|nr:GNAT family N-acetyltransferase [Desulfosarcina sp.]